GEGGSSLIAGYGFLFFALIVWPAYVPLFVWLLEKKRRRLISVFVAVGFATAGYFAWLLASEPLRVRERSSRVSYAFDAPSEWLVMPPYLIAILGALFASSRVIFRWFGAAIAALALIAWRLYE